MNELTRDCYLYLSNRIAFQDHDDAAELVGDGAADHVEVAAGGECDHRDVVDEREDQPLFDEVHNV